MDQDYHHLNLSKLKACNQYWSEMKPAEGGRVCAKCANVIYDFRDKSLSEIAKAHANKKGKVCGLYSSQQLKQGTSGTTNQKRIWWKALLVGVTYFFSTGTAEATGNANKNSIEALQKADTRIGSYAASGKFTAGSHSSDSLTIRGKIKAMEGRESIFIAGITVMVKGTDIGTVTGLDGSYLLPLPDTYKSSDTINLIFSYIGYGTREIPVQLSNRENVNITLSPDQDIIEFYVSAARPPLHKRIWYWLKNPFRK